MCPSPMLINQKHRAQIFGHKIPKKQQGFLMPLAMFIIVALAGLGLAISRLSSGSFSSAVQEAVAVQSLYAAESGAQYAMHELLFNVADKTTADANCTAVNGNIINFTVAGLNNCSSTVMCTLVTNTGDAARVYDITSMGACGGGDITAERTVAVRAIYE